MPESQETKDLTAVNSSAGCNPSVFTKGDYNYGNSYYSYKVGFASIIVVNSYTNSTTGSDQHVWLENTLKSINRTETPWLLAMMHCPWYNSNTNHYLEAQTVVQKSYFEDLFYNYRVNAVFSGHVHAYERSFPVYNGTVQKGGIQYFNIGDGGNREGHAVGYHEPSPAWSAYRDDSSFGSGRAVLQNTTHMLWEWRRNEDGESVITDQSWILNDFSFTHEIY